ncbi:LysR family transcriptional regulator [Pediococcus siamensis]|uniref:LysR family transcriptional regulator n=1 Tax=Pediococcus siamensis TaxID=381829 RepID=UPI0039A03166
MLLEYIKTFLALAKSQNFTEAADLLYISQSTLSKRIQKIETQLGVQLFDRTTKSVKLSDYGYIYLQYATKIVELENNCLEQINETVAHGNSLNIGAIPSIGQYGITQIITRFIQNSNVHVKVITAPSGKLEKLLYKHECDLAFIRDVSEEYTFQKVPYTTDHMVAVLPKNHHLANYKSIKIGQLKNDNFLLQPRGSRPYNNCITLCEHNGFTPNVLYTDDQVENILEFVASGMGISLLMEKLVDKTNPNIITVPVFPDVTSKIFLCYMPDSNLTKNKRQFISSIYPSNSVYK